MFPISLINRTGSPLQCVNSAGTYRTAPLAIVTDGQQVTWEPLSFGSVTYRVQAVKQTFTLEWTPQGLFWRNVGGKLSPSGTGNSCVIELKRKAIALKVEVTPHVQYEPPKKKGGRPGIRIGLQMTLGVVLLGAIGIYALNHGGITIQPPENGSQQPVYHVDWTGASSSLTIDATPVLPPLHISSTSFDSTHYTVVDLKSGTLSFSTDDPTLACINSVPPDQSQVVGVNGTSDGSQQEYAVWFLGCGGSTSQRAPHPANELLVAIPHPGTSGGMIYEVLHFSAAAIRSTCDPNREPCFFEQD